MQLYVKLPEKYYQMLNDLAFNVYGSQAKTLIALIHAAKIPRGKQPRRPYDGRLRGMSVILPEPTAKKLAELQLKYPSRPQAIMALIEDSWKKEFE